MMRVFRRITKIRTDYRSGEETEVVPRSNADVVTSEIVGTRYHAPLFDLDIPHWYVGSGTAGHGHLYIETQVSWRRYKRVLRAMVAAGIIEKGYYRATCQRGYASLRLPEKPKVAMR
jgi:hypothetical protein